MKLKHLLDTCKALAVASVLLTVPTARAVLISGNSGTGSGLMIGEIDIAIDILEVQAAVGFTMPGQSYTLTDVELRLSFYAGPSEASIGIFLDNGSGLPGALHALLTDPPAAGSPDLYSFTPAGSVVLAANTAYWLVVDYEDPQGFLWEGASDPPTGVATYNGTKRSANGGVSYVDSTLLRYAINGEAVTTSSVPDAGSTLPLLGAALGGLAWVNRRRKL